MGNSNKSSTFNLPDDSEYLGLFQSQHRLNFIATVSSSGNGWSMCGYYDGQAMVLQHFSTAKRKDIERRI